MKKVKYFVFVGILFSIISLTIFKLLDLDTQKVILQQASSNISKLTSDAGYSSSENNLLMDFTVAAKVSTPAVVHIKSIFISRQREAQRIPDELKEFFGEDFFFEPPGPRQTEVGGSGVIINERGYIITNNHVIDNADEIAITLYDNRVFTAKLIGADPATDLALVKIETPNDLPSLVIGNSDKIQVGEWVLAVGNPFNLSSTVTAGIVSAKGRNIHILRDNYAIESFIQTDAAVNQGNSGGALVNMAGELIGINTAIATPTSMYVGYAFAIPSGIVKKVSKDLIEFGIVQRAFLGVIIRDVDGKLAEELKLDVYEGVYIDSLLQGGAAKEAGIKAGDIIIEINDINVKNSAKLQELIGRSKPGEEVSITIIRKGKEKEFKVELKNYKGTSELLVKKEELNIDKVLGVHFKEITDEEKKKYGLKNGIQVIKLFNGKIRSATDMREGFIITKVDETPVNSVKEFRSILEKKRGGVLVEGIYPGFKGVYYYGFGL